MPLYEYECDQCGHRFEVIRRFSDPPLAACPKCGGLVHKMQSAPAFHLKGTGWYATDYAKKDESTAKVEDATKDVPGEQAGEKAGEKPGEKKDAATEKTDAAGKADAGGKTEKPPVKNEKSEKTSTGNASTAAKPE